MVTFIRTGGDSSRLVILPLGPALQPSDRFGHTLTKSTLAAVHGKKKTQSIAATCSSDDGSPPDDARSGRISRASRSSQASCASHTSATHCSCSPCTQGTKGTVNQRKHRRRSQHNRRPSADSYGVASAYRAIAAAERRWMAGRPKDAAPPTIDELLVLVEKRVEAFSASAATCHLRCVHNMDRHVLMSQVAC